MAEGKNEAPGGPQLSAKRKSEEGYINEEDDLKKKKQEISVSNPSIVDEKLNKEDSNPDAEAEAEADSDDNEDEDEDDEEDDDDDDEEETEDEEEDDKHSTGKALVDNKGKGIMKEEKGKALDDDSSDGGADLSDDDSDLSDDPLTEVDLDNILPSRTRRRVTHPGAYIANDLDGDDDSDDSDA